MTSSVTAVPAELTVTAKADPVRVAVLRATANDTRQALLSIPISTLLSY